MSNKKFKIETIAIHGGYVPDETNSMTIPIHFSSAYKFNSADHGADLFDLKVFGNIYSRIGNPTWDTFAEKVNKLEGGVGALATSSGQSATTIAILNICSSGEHILASQTLYGGSFSLFKNTLLKMGIEVTFVDPDLPIEELRPHIRENTRLIYGETIGNPKNNILDVKKFSTLAHENNIPLIVDNTYPTPYLFRPFEHGADIVVHSATKYLGGHGNALGGVIVDSGNFDWNSGKFPELTTPDESYHGLVYTEAFGNAAYILKCRTHILRDLGAALSPFNGFLLHTGLETLHLRMDRHSENALTLAKWLLKHPKVEWVSYPLLENHKDYELAKSYFPKGASGMVSFAIKGDLEAGKKVINSFELATHATNLGDVRTIVSHPASTTHRQLTEEEQISAGVLPNFIRISVGIENIEDIIADFDQALSSI